MRTEVSTHPGLGRPVSLLWLLLLLPLATLGQQRSPFTATLAPASGKTLERVAPTSTVQQLASGIPVCGKPKVMGKIYGGQDVVAGQWPWQASLLYRNLHICGAVLIDSFWLVSTAHCFLNKSHFPEDYQILLGTTQLYQHTQHTQKMAVNRIIMHPDFEKFHPFGSDIAMLQLYLPVNFTFYISPACLPIPGLQLPSHSSCWITEQLLPPFHLQEGKVNLIENKFCNMLYEQRLGKGKIYPVHDEMLCSGDYLTGKAICQGDSGSPLVCDVINAWVLVGLASWGLDCRHPIYPSVFTSVTYFSDWISEIQRLTPPPDPTAALPQTPFPYQPLQVSGCSRPSMAIMFTPTLLSLLSVLRAQGQALQ